MFKISNFPIPQASLRVGTVNMLVRNPEEEKKEKEKVKKPFKDSKASWYDDFVKNRKIITVHLHILHPAIRCTTAASLIHAQEHTGHL